MSDLPTQPPLPAPRRRRWLTWLLVGVIFIGGAAVGAGVTVIVAVRIIRQAIQHPEDAPARITSRLSRRLDLSDAQSRAIERIIARRQQALQNIRREIQPRVETELTSLEDEIEQTLTPAQKPRWRQMLRTLRENWLPPEP